MNISKEQIKEIDEFFNSLTVKCKELALYTDSYLSGLRAAREIIKNADDISTARAIITSFITKYEGKHDFD